MDPKVKRIADKLNLKDVASVQAGINAEAHVKGFAVIKGKKRTIGVKMPTYFAHDGAENECKAYTAARYLRDVIAMDGANVTYARMVDGAATIRWAEKENAINICKYQGFRNLSLARSYGRMVAFWSIIGCCDRHTGNFFMSPPKADGTGGSFWSIDHENTPTNPDLWVSGHFDTIKGWNAVVPNVPLANGRVHVAMPYPMQRFTRHAANEIRTIIAALETDAGKRAIEKIANIGRLYSGWRNALTDAIRAIESYRA